ncbi:hypothetical protein Pgy4_26755 [Pseudomonas savastanoi pv. glycinea str. race 4]|uniref:Uncharacterized protein n=1 Tax=Pseudomonas savastanoi pv. glycinea str. race 4 TaxID=875330 RepID=F3CBK1_PSESG|nr:hypothetical protein Pgy4_26755 [Pseudomonas savastanoi pv. glycinea str. race 4]KPC20034.1 Uncharacterized protein AC503_5048 [Pseudomonas syringae pv. maculicola]
MLSKTTATPLKAVRATRNGMAAAKPHTQDSRNVAALVDHFKSG